MTQTRKRSLDTKYAKHLLPHIAESVTAHEYRNDLSRLLDQYIEAAEKEHSIGHYSEH